MILTGRIVNMKQWRAYSLLIISLAYMAFLLSFSLVTPTWAQPSASDLGSASREVDRPIQQEIEKKLSRPPEKLLKDEEKEIKKQAIRGRTFFVKEIKLLGLESFPPEDFKRYVEKYENREVAITELRVLASQIERAYLKKDVIAACLVPPQEVKEGVVILRVVEAKMGDLHLKKQEYFSENRLLDYWELYPGEILRYDTISRNMQRMNKNPDRYIKATLHAGKKPETTDVILEGENTFPLHLTSTFDQEGTITTGRTKMGVGFLCNNFMGWDDILLANYKWGKHFTGAYVYHKIPITNFGTSLLYGYSRNRAIPKKDYGGYDMFTHSGTGSVSVHQDLFEKDEYKGEFSFGLEAKDKNTIWQEGTLNYDRLRNLKIGLLYIERDRDSIIYIKPRFYQGLNLFGARRTTPYTSRGSKNTFTKANLGITYKKALAYDFVVNTKFNSQIAGQNLPPQEEMYLGGIDTVRGYPSADFLADNGFFTNVELVIPSFMIPEELKFPYGENFLRDEITGVLFFDYGYGEKKFSLPSEEKRHILAGVGAGVRVKLLNQALLRLEWAHPLRKFAEPPKTESSHSRLHVSLDFQENFPEEFENFKDRVRRTRIEDKTWAILNKEIKRPDSPLHQRLQTHLSLARKADFEGDFETAKEYYSKISITIKSAYRQAKDYVKQSEKHLKKLKEYRRVALESFKEGNLDKAKEAWEKIKEEAYVAPLTIEVL